MTKYHAKSEQTYHYQSHSRRNASRKNDSGIQKSAGQAFGGRIVRADQLMHGKTSPIHHDTKNLFKDLPNPLTATRYHSLIAERSSLPECLKVTAETKEGEIMGIEHTSLPIWGVQFHPESLATEKGIMILKNFLEVC